MFSMEVVSYIKILFYRSLCHHFQSLVKMVKYVIMWQLNLNQWRMRAQKSGDGYQVEIFHHVSEKYALGDFLIVKT